MLFAVALLLTADTSPCLELSVGEAELGFFRSETEWESPHPVGSEGGTSDMVSTVVPGGPCAALLSPRLWCPRLLEGGFQAVGCLSTEARVPGSRRGTHTESCSARGCSRGWAARQWCVRGCGSPRAVVRAGDQMCLTCGHT